MKFIQKILGCCRSRRNEDPQPDPFSVESREVEKGKCSPHLSPIPASLLIILERANKSAKKQQGMPKWVEMKCNALVYLKQLMKDNREKKLKLIKQEKDELKAKEEEKEKEEDKEREEDKEIIDNKSKEEGEEIIQSQTNESMSMMCPICHFFMNKSVCTSCGHMFCQYCLDEYLIFKDSCPVCEKSIRKGKITRWWVADSAIEKMLMFSKEQYSKEYALKVKFEEEYFAKKKLDDSIIEKFNQ